MTGNRSLAEKQLAINKEKLEKALLRKQDEKIIEALKATIELLAERLK